MLFDLNNELHRNQFIQRHKSLLDKRCVVELTEKKPKRTIPQNRYLHSLLGYFGTITGNTLEYVKHHYFKILVNPQIFIAEKDDRFRGKIKYVRSSAEITTEEMVIAIERFRDWSASEADLYLPSPEEHLLIQQMEIEIERAKAYL